MNALYGFTSMLMSQSSLKFNGGRRSNRSSTPLVLEYIITVKFLHNKIVQFMGQARRFLKHPCHQI